MTRSELEKQAERSKAIDRALDAEGEKLRRECKVLVLGGPESGAETLMKQLEIFKNGYSTEELLLYRDGVRRMALKAMQAAMEHLRETGIELDNEDMNYAEIILKEIGKSQESVTEITLAAANVMKSLWDSPRSRSFFYETVANDSTYAGIQEYKFKMGLLDIRMFDCGEQWSGRKKLMHQFEHVVSILFVVDISSYDQVLQDSSTDLLIEALSSIILLFNKVDRFKQNLATCPLSNYFPDYSGGFNHKKATNYILWRFNQVNRTNLSLYPFLANETDASYIRPIFAAIKDTILKRAYLDTDIGNGRKD
ncbi:G-protein alpha subunit-domain-containing protein [Trichophaea hybrida]|nr:G-protein alpha subunit-domain-containing protein [Trichophaea hybrida]